MGYKQTKRLKKAISVSTSGIKRRQSALDKIAQSKKAGMGVKAIADFGSATIGAIQSIDAATTGNKQEWEQLEEGREAVGMDRTDSDLSMFDKIGRRMKGPGTGKEIKWDDSQMSDDEFSAYVNEESYTGQEAGSQYTKAELKRIGKETIAGTSESTLKDLGEKDWSFLADKGDYERSYDYSEPEQPSKPPTPPLNVNKTLGDSLGQKLDFKKLFDPFTGGFNTVIKNMGKYFQSLRDPNHDKNSWRYKEQPDVGTPSGKQPGKGSGIVPNVDMDKSFTKNDPNWKGPNTQTENDLATQFSSNKIEPVQTNQNQINPVALDAQNYLKAGNKEVLGKDDLSMQQHFINTVGTYNPTLEDEDTGVLFK